EEYPDLFAPAEDTKVYVPSDKQLEFDANFLNELEADYPALDDLKQEAKDRVQEKQQTPKEPAHEVKRAEPER
ncbi:MAG: hypothetical protein IKL97_00595, partial [Eggerthellaceae bacterium]|nr:hypothetical protein [Eggerthellaceae bacterium]